MLAEGYRAAGQAEAGQSVLDEALASADRSQEVQWTADLHRLKGELLLASASEGPAVRRAGEPEDAEASPEDSFARRLTLPGGKALRPWSCARP